VGVTSGGDTLFDTPTIVVLSDRPGLRQVDQVEKVQSKLMESLQNLMKTNHAEDNTLFAKLVMKTHDLRTLNALHDEKSVGMVVCDSVLNFNGYF